MSIIRSAVSTDQARRQEEAERERHEAGEQGEPGAHAGELEARQRPVAAARVMKPRAPPRQPFERNQYEHEPQQERRELGRRRRIAQPEPRAVDPGGKGVDPEIGDRAEIGQGFHEGKRETSGDRRPGQRQGDPGKALPR
jgi:hypothetical protein